MNSFSSEENDALVALCKPHTHLLPGHPRENSNIDGSSTLSNRKRYASSEPGTVTNAEEQGMTASDGEDIPPLAYSDDGKDWGANIEVPFKEITVAIPATPHAHQYEGPNFSALHVDKVMVKTNDVFRYSQAHEIIEKEKQQEKRLVRHRRFKLTLACFLGSLVALILFLVLIFIFEAEIY